MNWHMAEHGFNKERIELLGSKFCIGNGYFGYRGTLDEYGEKQLTACTLSEIFDDNGCGWREPVNMPNGLYTNILYKGKALTVLQSDIKSHEQSLDFDCGLHKRKTIFLTEDGKELLLESERFASIENLHLLLMRYRVTALEKMELAVVTDIDTQVWDANGPHFASRTEMLEDDISGLVISTIQGNKEAAVGQKVYVTEGKADISRDGLAITLHVDLQEGETLEFVKYVSICKETDCEDVWKSAVADCQSAQEAGYDELLKRQKKAWAKRYAHLGIHIGGDEEAEQAVYYSCYLLLISAPFHTDTVAIPARGLSGQVYKGGMFWDTEIYMLPMFAFCEPETARNLVRYRIHNLKGAIEKAQEYGYRGAFYPWESQENGKDGCTHYNLTDIFTGRKMRTYFRDKQVHISADVVYGIWKYISITKDYGLLADGGAEVILECARFFYSFSYYKNEKQRYEFLDVTGADEYHERINNDAYTNYMIQLTMRTALEVAEYMEQRHHAQYVSLIDRLNYWEDMEHIKEMCREIYVPKPNVDGVIEQFDGYFKEEDLSVEALYARIIKENEYLGSPCGLAVNTQIIKQADVVLLLSLLSEQFDEKVKESNWAYYEPRTEHGSSLSTCIYALLAAQIGKTDWAYEFMMKAATIDLKGNYKLYLGDLYIGGTHPAANGGTWMVTVQGFGGLTPLENGVRITPHLPKQWEELTYCFAYAGSRYQVKIGKDMLEVTAIGVQQSRLKVETVTGNYCCEAGEVLCIAYKEKEDE